MAVVAHTFRAGLLAVAFFSALPYALGKDEPGGGPRRSSEASDSARYGPGNVYGKIPERDEFGRDQLAMFREWNPDPVGNHEANLRTVDPLLAKVVRKAQSDNPGLRFVIGSGRRDDKLQRKAVAWGWSKTKDSPHRSGNAVDLWPLDAEGGITFDPKSQSRIGAAMRRAAAELGVLIRWGGNFHSFKHLDRSHFELDRTDGL
jgi:peptidoglycan LD-endopeptidase CwlK